MDGRKAVSLEVRSLYEGGTIDLELHRVELPNGLEHTFEIVRHPGASAVVPLTDDGDVLLLRQLRYAAENGYLYEVPAGKLAPGEAPEVCAARELEEEAGVRAGRLEHLTTIWMTPGFCDERIHLYLATDLTEGSLSPEADEVLEVCRVPFGEAIAMIERGEITDAKTISALSLAMLRLGALADDADRDTA
jgi:ADP-ribose pyrophosphatase